MPNCSEQFLASDVEGNNRPVKNFLLDGVCYSTLENATKKAVEELKEN